MSPDWQTEFIDHLWHVDGLAMLSIREARRELIRWQRWLDMRGLTWQQVSSADLTVWLGEIVGLQARSTVDKRSWVLRRLYRWALQCGHTSTDPWLRIARPSSPYRWRPRFTPSPDAVMRLLIQPDTGTFRGVRDRAILELLYASGLRAAELLSLRVDQINAAERAIRVIGKGQIERMVVYGESAQTWLRYYLLGARSRLLQPVGRPSIQLFVNDKGSGSLSYAVLRAIIRRHADAAGLPLLTAHSLRHAFATHLYQGGANLQVIQMLLGHACIATTTIYAKTSAKHLTKLLDRHHPRGALYEARSHKRDWHESGELMPATRSDGFERLIKIQAWGSTRR